MLPPFQPPRARRAPPPTIVHDADHGDLLDRLAQAEAALRARDDFLAIAAHELRSPLHALGLRVAALERLAARTGHQVLERELHRTRRSVDRYVRRAVTLLDLSRLHAGMLQPTPALVRAAEVVRAVVDDYAEEAQFHGAALHAEADEGLRGWWDPHMIEQVLANLVSNAIKYGEGTPVLVSARPHGEAHACFEVSDRGPGIDEADRSRIFDKFERIVQELGGTIDVSSTVGSGTTFTVRLPLATQSGTQRAA